LKYNTLALGEKVSGGRARPGSAKLLPHPKSIEGAGLKIVRKRQITRSLDSQ